MKKRREHKYKIELYNRIGFFRKRMFYETGVSFDQAQKRLEKRYPKAQILSMQQL